MKKILILSANPINTDRLRLEEEVREIRLALERAPKREVFQLIPIGAVRIDDLRRTLLNNQPQIVHFSGHGTESNDLVLENISGEPQTVNPESLSKLFELCKEQIECVLLNACYSEIQAEAIHRHIDCVIGMVQAIQDRAAINFSKGFYDAIFSGRNYADAFRFGCNNIDLNNIPESHTPTIKIRHKDSSPQDLVTNNTYKQVIGTAVLGLSAGLVGLIQLGFGNAGLITNVLLAFGSVTLWMCCAYIYYPSSRIFGFSVTPRLLHKQYKRLRRLALAGMIIIPLLSATGFYVLQLPTKDIIVLIADFKGEEPEKYRVTENIFDSLDDASKKYPDPDVKIQRLNQVVTEQKDALTEGKKHKAAIVIWGDYGVTDTAVQLSAHFEVLRPPKYLPKIGRLEHTAAVSELKNFKLQASLSHEMVYLSLFTVGLTRVTASDWDRAIASFTDALKNIKEPISALDESRVYFSRGNSYLIKGEDDRSLNDYNQAIKLNPNYDDAYYNRGIIYLKKGEDDRSLNDFNKAIKLNPNYVEAYNIRGIVYLKKGEDDRSLNDFNKAIKLNPNYVEAYKNRGIIYLKKGEDDRSLNDFNKAIKLNPNYVEAYIYRGNVYSENGEDSRAINDFNQAIKLNSNNANAYYNRGYYYSNKREYDRAINDYNQAIKLDPKYVGAYDSRGVVHLLKHEYNRVINDYTQVIKLEPNNASAYYNRGSAYQSQNEYDRAIDDFNQSIKLNPNYAEAYNERGITYLNKGEDDRSLNDYNQAIKLNPNYDDAYYNRGIFYLRKGEYSRVIYDYNRAIKLNPDSMKFRIYPIINSKFSIYELAINHFNQAIKLNPNDANTYNERGYIYFLKGEYSRAINDFNQSIKLNYNDARVYYNRGNLYLTKGDYDQAINDFNITIKLNPKDADAYGNRGNSYLNKGEYDQAINDFNIAIKLNPKDADTYGERCEVYVKKGDYDRAIADCKQAIKLHQINHTDKTIENYKKALELKNHKQ